VRRTWWGPPLEDEQQAVLDLVDDLVATRLHRAGDERTDEVDRAREVLAEHGLWTVGADETHGGGGADLATTLVVVARVAGTWPALAWACVQAHAAALVLEGVAEQAALLESIHAGDPVAVCPVDAPEGEDVQVSGTRLTGAVPRVDTTSSNPRLVVLMEDAALVVPPSGVTAGPVLRRTGLDGAQTVGCRIDATLTEGDVVRSPQVARARTMLDVGASAVAAGIAEAVAQAALAYGSSRVQFGAPLTELPTVRGSLSRQAAAARSLLTSAVRQGLDDATAAAATLHRACDEAIDVAAASVQAHGGYGYMAEYGVEGLLRDAVSLRAAARAQDAALRGARGLVGAHG
jgi:alkylation response protein AidB-like acyl-CoA dehydrogenase